MAGKRLKVGDILAIPLQQGLGYAYAKYINLKKFYSECSYPDLIRIYDYRSMNPDIDISGLKDRELLFSPLLVGSLPPTVSKGIWKIVGNLPIEDEEQEIPHYRTFGPPWAINQEDITEWFYVENADIDQKGKTEFDKVKHLENLGASGTGILEIKISMAFLLKEGEKVEDYFDLKEQHEINAYEKLKEVTPYYELPLELRGKVVS